jgi:glycerol kinase
MSGYILAIDQGTTSSRAIVFDGQMRIVGVGQKEFTQYYPQSGWVEHDPEEIWKTVVTTVKQALKKAGIEAPDVPRSASPTSARRLWCGNAKPASRSTMQSSGRTVGQRPIARSSSGRDSRRAFTRKTGLLLDPYFSGTKLSWMLSNVKGSRTRAARGELCFGTIDTFLIWRLTGGKSFVTDATNASRTLMFNIATQEWDAELLKTLRVPAEMLPEVKDCAADFGVTDKPSCSVPKSRSSAWPEISRRPPSVRPVSSRACSNPPMAPAVLRCSTPARTWFARGTGC